MKIFNVVFMLTALAALVIAQNLGEGYLTDEFGRITNDDLLARVDYFNSLLDKKPDTQGVVVLHGLPTHQHLMRRRIEGCNLMRHQRIDRYRFVFAPSDVDLDTRFYAVPITERLQAKLPDYGLPDLKDPIELNEAFSTGDFCPLHFDLDWFSRFLNANPSFVGKAVVDTNRKDFIRRVARYRRRLASLGVDATRVRFLRKHFAHEHDEQWWLIPFK
jgi:hypothetical protein